MPLVLGATAHTKATFRSLALLPPNDAPPHRSGLCQPRPKSTFLTGRNSTSNMASQAFEAKQQQAAPSLAKALDYYNTAEQIHSNVTATYSLLLYLMTFVEDGNLIHRGGIDAYKQVQHEAQQLFEEAQTLTETELTTRLENYDNVLIERNLSPEAAQTYSRSPSSVIKYNKTDEPSSVFSLLIFQHSLSYQFSRAHFIFSPSLRVHVAVVTSTPFLFPLPRAREKWHLHVLSHFSYSRKD